MSDLTESEIGALADRLFEAVAPPLAPRDSGYWAPTDEQVADALVAVLRTLQDSANSRGVGLNFEPLMTVLVEYGQTP